MDSRPHPVEVWRISLRLSPDRIPERLRILSADERRRSDTFVHVTDRHRWIASRAALREVLAARLRLAPDQVQFEFGPQGKPHLDRSVHDDELQFNLAHSGALALLAVSTGVPVGVDVEAVRDFPEMLAVARQHFCPRELAELHSLRGEQVSDAFHHCWTRKEACLKALGCGLSRPVHDVYVSCRSDGPSRVTIVEGPDGHAVELQLVSLNPGPGYQGALAIRSACDCSIRAME